MSEVKNRIISSNQNVQATSNNGGRQDNTVHPPQFVLNSQRGGHYATETNGTNQSRGYQSGGRKMNGHYGQRGLGGHSRGAQAHNDNAPYSVEGPYREQTRGRGVFGSRFPRVNSYNRRRGGQFN